MSAKDKNKHGDSAGRSEIPLFNPDDVIIIGHDTKDGPEHPLCDVESNETPLNEATVRFTMKNGVLQHPDGRRDGKDVIIVFGRGRTRHLREANKRLIAEGKEPWLLPVKIVKGDDLKMMELMQGENSHRRALDPYVRATRAQLLIDKGKPKADVADLMGVSLQQLGNILLLLELAPQIIKEVRRGTLSQTAATGLAKLPRGEQVTKVKEILAGAKKPTVRDVQNKVREGAGQAPVETPKMKIAKASALLMSINDSEMDRVALGDVVAKLRFILMGGEVFTVALDIGASKAMEGSDG